MIEWTGMDLVSKIRAAEKSSVTLIMGQKEYRKETT